MVDKLKQLESDLHSIKRIEDLLALEEVFSKFEYLAHENQKQFSGILHYGLFDEISKTKQDLKVAEEHKKSQKRVERFETALRHLKDDIKYVLDGIERYDS